MNVFKSILDPTDMVAPRTPRELCAWVEAKTSALSQSEEAKAYARSGETLPKKLWEEIRPFALFAKNRFGSTDVRCTPNLGNQNYDGMIEFTDRSREPLYVEITYAKDGYDERLRMEVLSAEGSVNALGKVTVAGTRASGGHRVNVENEMVAHEDVRNKGLALLTERIRRKAGKSYSVNHVLVVVIDDYLAFRTEMDRTILVGSAQSVVANENLDFTSVFLLGASGKYLFRVRREI